MREKIKLSGVPETMLQTIYARAKESRGRGAIHDAKAEEIIEKLDYDFSLADKDTAMRSGVIARTIVLDRMTKEWLASHPGAVVVNIACGLDTRCYRMSGYAHWYNLDLPETMAVREKLLPESGTISQITMSAMEDWGSEISEQNVPVLIVIEGLDGSGKATQAKLLAQHLASQGLPVREVTFPDYASDSSALIKMYLAGQFGSKPDDVNAYAASSFFAVDRYASYKTDWGRFYEEGGVVIADRYTTSNAVHQCSKLPPEQWEEFLHWLFDYEFHLLGLPAPDSVIYLQVDPAVSQRLMTARYHGDESKKDVHEKDTEYLARSRRAAEYCAEHLGWTTVHCTHSDAMRSIEDIQAEVQGIVLGGQ